MKSCPNINHPEYIELQNKFGKATAIALYHLNGEKLPSLLKAYKMQGLTPDKQTIYLKREQGMGEMRKFIDQYANGINENSVQFVKDTIERYGFEDIAMVGGRTKKQFILDKEGKKLRKDSLYVIDEERELNTKVIDLTKSMFSAYSNIMKDVNNSGTINSSQDKFNLYRKELNRPPSAMLNSINLYKKLLGPEKKHLSTDEVAFISAIFSSIGAYKNVIAQAKNSGVYLHLLNTANPINKHHSESTKDLIVITEIFKDLINDTSKDSENDYSKNATMSGATLDTMTDFNKVSKVAMSPDMKRSAGILLFKIKQGIESLNNSNIEEVVDGIREEFSEEVKDLSDNAVKIRDEISKVLLVDNKISDIDETLKRRKVILQKMYAIQTNLKQIESRKYAPNMELLRKVHDRIEAMEKQSSALWTTSLDRINYLGSVHKALHMDVVGDFNDLIKEIKERDFINGSIQSSSHILLKARDLISDYGELLDLLKKELSYISNQYAEKGATDKVLAELANVASELSDKIKELEAVTSLETSNHLHRFLKVFMPNGGNITFGNKSYSLDDILNLADEDIGIIDRFLQSTKDSNNSFLRLIDNPIKHAKRNVYNKSLEIMYEIQDAHDKLMKSGEKNTEFMYERKNNVLTGNFKNKFNEKYEKELKEYYKKEKRKDRDKPGREIYEEFKEKNGYYTDGVYTPNSVFLSDDYVRMTSAQKEYFNFITDLKSTLEKQMPFKMRGGNLAPQLRKDFFERMRNGNFTDNMKSYLKDLYSESQNDDVIVRESDIVGKKRQAIPIRFNTLFDNVNDMSLDASGSMIAYANMAINFEELNGIVDTMELLREHIAGVKITSDGFSMSKGRVVKQIDASESEMFKRMNDTFESALYGKPFKDQGTIGKTNINKRKVANLAIKATVLNTLAINALAGAANIFTGLHNARIEAIGGQFFNYKDYLSSIKEYTSHIPSLIADIESQRPSSFINLVNDYFHITQGTEDQFKSMDIYKKSKIFRILNPKQAFMLMNGGEHMLGMISGMAYLKSHKVIDAQGKQVGLYSQLIKDGYRLKVKEGTRNLDGSLFTDNDRADIQLRIREIAERLNGIYNDEDKSAAQRTWQGSLIFLYRRYLIPNLNNRFGKSNYNYALGAETKGYHMTILNYIGGLAKNRKDLIAFSKDYWTDMSELDRRNLKKSISEVGYVFLMMGLFSLLTSGGVGDDGDDPYWERMLLYQIRRQTTEVGALSIVFPYNVNEALTLFKSPTAALDYVSKTTDLAKMLLKPSDANHVMQSGPYEGYTRWQKNIIEISPYYKMWIRNRNPEVNIKYLEQDK